MNQPATEIIVNDPLLYDVPMPYRRVLYPFCFPAVIATNCETIARTAETLWGRFAQRHDGPAVELRLLASESGASTAPAANIPRAQGHLISTIHDASNWVSCDLRTGFAFGWLTPVVANDAARVRYHFVEPYVMLMLEARYMTPIHAGCVVHNGKGVLLCGDSEAGKTTLSYACARKGWTYVGDDGSHLIRSSTERKVAGMPYQVRFRPPAALLFPELAGYVPLERPNGKPSLELDTADLNIDVAEQAHIDYLVFLNRKCSGGQQMVPYDKSDALAHMEQTICVGEESVRTEQRASLRRLLAVPVFEMKYYDLDWAEQRLRTLVESGR